MMYDDVLSFHNVMGDKLTWEHFIHQNFSKVNILTDCFDTEKKSMYFGYIYLLSLSYIPT